MALEGKSGEPKEKPISAAQNRTNKLNPQNMAPNLDSKQPQGHIAGGQVLPSLS